MAILRLTYLFWQWLLSVLRWVPCILGKHYFIGEEGYSMYCKTCTAYWQNTPRGGYWIGFKKVDNG